MKPGPSDRTSHGAAMIPYSVLDLSPIAEGDDAAQALSNSRDLARHAEGLGYHRFWLAEHHNMPGIASAATSIVIGHVAAGTSRIRVGAGGIMLPNHSPLVIGEARTVSDHLGEVCTGVYRIGPHTSGSGRFLEAIPAELGLPTYLIVDAQDGTLVQRLHAVLADFGDVEALYGVDTGGDSLHRASVADKARATPDQDLASFRALAELNIANSYSVIVAPGVDSPPYAAEVLASAQAKQLLFSVRETDAILGAYRAVRLDGSDSARTGKTALAWQAALRGERGPVRLPLPDHLVNDPRNPWNPMVTVTDEMAGGYVMTIRDHLRALGSPA